MSNKSKSEINSFCANCGKGEEASIDLKSCAACMLVKYCSRECQITHRPHHKRECKKRAAELHDEKLFEQPPPSKEDCPICMIRLPSFELGRTYMVCCGKTICCGCMHAFQSRATKKEHDICPFCRSPPPYSDGEMIKRYEKRVEMNDPIAIRNLGHYYNDGLYGFQINHTKALELWHRAGKLGSAGAYYNIGIAYEMGMGVVADKGKAKHYWELAGMGGNVHARHNLGVGEMQKGNMDRALRHWMITAKEGDSESLKNIKLFYSNGYATKDDYDNALKSYQEYLDEIKSDQRDEAVIFDGKYRYFM